MFAAFSSTPATASSPEPFRVEVSSSLPDGVKSVLTPGLVELTVEPGHTLVALGVEGEEFIRVAKDGTVSANASSMTFQMADMTTPPAPESGWFTVADDGSVSYHEHRIHFMASRVSPDIKDGGIVTTFALDFLIDGEPAVLKGDLMFDPSINPERAKQYVDGTATSKGACQDASGESGKISVAPDGGVSCVGKHASHSPSGFFLTALFVAFFLLVMAGFVLYANHQAS